MDEDDEVVDEQDVVDEQKEQPALEDPEDDEGDGEDAPEISLGGEDEPPVPDEQLVAPRWVKDLRKERRELIRENRELKAKMQTVAPTPELTLGKKPALSDEGIDYNAEVFEERLLEWTEKKRQIEEAEKRAEDKRKAEEQAWAGTLKAYQTKKESLRLHDYDDAEFAVQEALSPAQQGIMLSGAAMPAELVYALGKNPKELKALAAITDPVKFAFAIAKLEVTKLKVSKKGTPAPERRVVAASSGVVDSDARLKVLRAEAERSGDYTKVMEYKRRKKG